MSQIESLVDHLKRIQEGNAWHGPALREVLAGTTAQMASARPIPAAHTIWDLLLHITGWENVFLRRLQGFAENEPAGGDFPALGKSDEHAWSEAITKLEQVHEQLINAVARLKDDSLHERVAGKDYTNEFMINGIIAHHVYHTGQIALLKRAQAQ